MLALSPDEREQLLLQYVEEGAYDEDGDFDEPKKKKKRKQAPTASSSSLATSRKRKTVLTAPQEDVMEVDSPMDGLSSAETQPPTVITSRRVEEVIDVEETGMDVEQMNTTGDDIDFPLEDGPEDLFDLGY